MTVSFMGSEVSALNVAGAIAENTTAGNFRAANGRAAINLLGNLESCYGEWDSAVGEGWIHWVANSSYDNDLTDNVLIVTDGSAVNLFRLMTSAVATFQAQYWSGGAWNNVGATFGVDTALSEFVVHLVAGASGSFEVYQDSTLLSSGTFASTATDMKRATFYSSDDASSINFSEVMLGDAANTLIFTVCETEPPTADGTDTAGTGTYADVDEVPFNDADVLVLANDGDNHSFTSAARTGGLAVVLGVSVGARMRCEVTGPQNARFYLKLDGVRYYSDTFALTTTHAAYQYTWDTDPRTSFEPWSLTDAQGAGLEWGIEAVA